MTKFNKSDIPKSLLNIIKSPSWLKTGISINTDIQYLSNSYILGNCMGVLDLSYLVNTVNMKNPKLVNVYNRFCNDTIDKISSDIDWTCKMSQKYLDYCCYDGIMSYKIGETALDIFRENLYKHKLNSNKIVLHYMETILEKRSYISILYELCNRKKIHPPNYRFIKNHNLTGFICVCKVYGTETVANCDSKQKSKEKASELMIDII